MQERQLIILALITLLYYMFCVAHIDRVWAGGLPQNRGSPHDLYPESLHKFQSFLVVAFIMSISVITFSAYVCSKVCTT